VAPIVRWAVVIVALPLLAWGGYWAARMGEADASWGHEAIRLADWQQMRYLPRLEERIAMQAVLERAARLSPANPSIPESLGLLQLQSGSHPENAVLALEHFAIALENRPGSPYTWANIAEARAIVRLPDAEVLAPLMTAWRQGPSEPEVQRTMVDLGLGMFDRANPDLQGIVKTAMANAMRRSPYRTLPIAFRHNRLDLACPYVPGDKRLEKTVWPRRCKNER
jgi:hypothetical protein